MKKVEKCSFSSKNAPLTALPSLDVCFRRKIFYVFSKTGISQVLGTSPKPKLSPYCSSKPLDVASTHSPLRPPRRPPIRRTRRWIGARLRLGWNEDPDRRAIRVGTGHRGALVARERTCRVLCGYDMKRPEEQPFVVKTSQSLLEKRSFL